MMSFNDTKLPIGRLLGRNAYLYLGALTGKLDHLEIERYFTALILIEQYYPTTSQQQIADHLGINKAAMVRILNYLTRHGFVIRETDKSDGRKHRVRLTTKAIAHMPQIHQAVEELNSFCAKNISKGEWKTFLKVLNKMNENLRSLPSREIVVQIRSKKVH